MRFVAFCWWKVRFYPSSALSHSRDKRVVIPVIPWDLPFPELLETTSTMWFCFSCNGWAISPHPFPLSVFLWMLTALLLFLWHHFLSWNHTHPAQNQWFFLPNAEGIMKCWNIQVLLFRLIYPKSFKSCKVPSRTSARSFIPHSPDGILSLLVNCFFISTKESPGNNSLSVWKVQRQREMDKYWKRRINCFLGWIRGDWSAQNPPPSTQSWREGLLWISIYKPTFSMEPQGEGMSQRTETEWGSMKPIPSKPFGPEMSGRSFLEESIRPLFLPACTWVSKYLNYCSVFHCTLTLRAQCFIGRRLIQLTHPGASSQAQTDLLTAGIGSSTGHCSSNVPSSPAFHLQPRKRSICDTTEVGVVWKTSQWFGDLL